MKNDKRISLDIIKRWLNNDQYLIRTTALNTCKDREIPIEIIEQGLNDDIYFVRAAAMSLCKDREVPIEFIKQGLKDEYYSVHAAAIIAGINKENYMEEIIEQGLKDEDYRVYSDTINECIDKDIPRETIKRWLKDDKNSVRNAAMILCTNLKDIPISLIEQGLRSNNNDYIYQIAVNACKEKKISKNTIKRWLNDKDWRVRYAAMKKSTEIGEQEIDDENSSIDNIIEQGLNDSRAAVRNAAINACIDEDISIETIKRWINNDDDWVFHTAAMKACIGKEVPIEIIEQGLYDDDSDIRDIAINACNNKEIPMETIKRWLLDDYNYAVRAAAINACKKRGIPIPIFRSIEPPETVYKKCIGDVIVCASIPKDAQIRGSMNDKCRANKAVITDIIGDIDGEKIGIAKYDNSISYFIGDEINIEDFDMGNDICSSGFHFFCTKELAETY